MSAMPKAGTIEHIVLELLMKSDNGITRFDLPPEHEMTEEQLSDVISRLRHGIFETEKDDQIIFDA